LKAQDPKRLLEELVGTDGVFETDELSTLMRGVINQALPDVLGTSKIAALDLAQNYEEMAAELNRAVNERIDDEYGLEVPQLFIVNISLPEAVEKALDTRTSMGVIGDMNRFQQYQMGQAMTQAASNPAGGGAADGMGLGMGFAMANQMMGGMNRAGVGGAPAAPPPPPPAAAWHLAIHGQTLGPFGPQELQQHLVNGQLTRETLVWCAGMSGWQPAGSVPQLAHLFGPPAPPPPPPPPGS
jgi:membrane protease subunit (stomatin/prohibitin family)